MNFRRLYTDSVQFRRRSKSIRKKKHILFVLWITKRFKPILCTNVKPVNICQRTSNATASFYAYNASMCGYQIIQLDVIAINRLSLIWSGATVFGETFQIEHLYRQAERSKKQKKNKRKEKHDKQLTLAIQWRGSEWTYDSQTNTERKTFVCKKEINSRRRSHAKENWRGKKTTTAATHQKEWSEKHTTLN